MAEPKAQLVAPVGNINLPGMNATGVITSTSFSGVGGVVTNLTGSPDLDVGIVTGSSFIGDGTGHAASLTGTPELNLGITTATSFTGDATGKAAGLTGTPNLNVGLITATSFVGFVTGNVTGNLTGNVQGNIVGDVTGNLTGLASSLKPGNSIGVGVCTAIQYHGDGSSLTGAGSSAWIAQEITADGPETIIDLSDGNLIYYTGTPSTTVGFASTAAAEQITIIRDTDPNYSISLSTAGVEFDGAGDYLDTESAYVDMSSSFCVETWVYFDSTGGSSDMGMICSQYSGGQTGRMLFGSQDNNIVVRINGNTVELETGENSIATGQWYHVAWTWELGNSHRLFLNGALKDSCTSSDISTVYTGTHTEIAGQTTLANFELDGKISNFRIVQGQAVYTEPFQPPSGELTINSQGVTGSNCKLLCCQSDSSTTAATVSAATIVEHGDPSAGAQTITLSAAFTGTTITWPSTVKWNGNTTPTLITNNQSQAFQIFHLTTVDTGASYQGWEEMKNDSLGGKYELFAWGYNQQGEQGLNDKTARSSPTQIGTASDWSVLDFGTTSSFETGVITYDKKLWMWGTSAYGQLGLNDIVSRSSPIQLPGTTWTKVVTGSSMTIATKSDGTLWSWGLGASGAGLGQNAEVNLSSPTQIGTGSDWSTSAGKIARAAGATAAIKNDGSLWIWADNNVGQLGLNNKTTYSSPKLLAGTWNTISCISNATLATKTDGTLWSWGQNSYGMLGLNEASPAKYSSPTQVGTNTTWSGIVPFGGWYACATIKTDGTMWAWGAGDKGSLAQNDTISYSSPIQIGSGNDWSKVVKGNDGTSAALKTNGTLWTWGNNISGGLGLNTPNNSNLSSPAQVPGTWGDIYCNDALFGLKSS